jgi:hypothetical protein
MKTPIANMIADMHGKGIPVELIVSAVATLEEAMAARAVSTGIPVDTSMMEKRRAWDRERKRKQAAAKNSGGIPPDHSTGIPPETPCIIREKKEDAIQLEVKEKKESKRIARGTRIPPEFAIDDDDRKFAAALGIPPETVEAETPAFIDYWSGVSGSKGIKLSWKGTWRNRMRDIKKYMPTSRGNVRVTSEFQRSRNETKDILNDLDNFAAGRSGGSQANPRLLSGDTGQRPEGIRGGVGGDVIDLPASGYRSRG